MKQLGFSLVALLTLFVADPARAQRLHHKISAGLSWSVPVGKYASTALEDGSFAKPGFGALLEYEVRGDKWPSFFGAMLHLSYQRNPVDNDAAAQAFTDALNYRTTMGESSYHPIIITLGPAFHVHASEAISIGFKTGIGVAVTRVDAFDLTFYDDQNQRQAFYRLEFLSRPNFTFLLGANVAYTLSDDIALMAFGDYSAARNEVDASLETFGRVDSYFNVAFVNVGAGITIRLR